MKIAAISDLHGNLPIIEQCDALLICGDISPLMIQRNDEAMTRWMQGAFNTWINKLPCDKVFLIAGNHDAVPSISTAHSEVASKIAESSSSSGSGFGGGFSSGGGFGGGGGGGRGF